MTRKELSEKIGYSEVSIKKSFNRTNEQVHKKLGLHIVKTGKGDNTDYELEPYVNQPDPVIKDKNFFTNRLIGQRFGHLTVEYDTGEREYRSIVWMCKCDCGNEHKVTSNHLKSGHAKSCGQPSCPYHNYYKDLTGQKFGHLTALYPTTMKDGTHMYWMCSCDCGNPELKQVASNHLKAGNVQSCGCIKTSIGEQNIENILKQYNIPYQTQVSFNDLKNKKPLRFDFGIYDKQTNKLTRLIEFDGIQHYEEQTYFTHSLTETKNNDKIKNEYCKDNNIPLIRIPYWERDKITLEMLLGDQYLI